MTDQTTPLTRTPALLDAVRRIATEEGMFPCAETSPEVLEIASRGMADPKSLTEAEIQSVCASAVAQAPKPAE